MGAASSRELCLWVVGAKDGKVRKLRFTLRTFLGAVGVIALVASAFVFIASDYARVQLQRAQTFLHLKHLLHEKDKLETSRQSLRTQVESLETQRERARAYEQEIRTRLEELAALLQTSDPGKVLTPEFRAQGAKGKFAPKSLPLLGSDPAAETGIGGAETPEGVGGAEIDCIEDSARCSSVASSGVAGKSTPKKSAGTERLGGKEFEARASLSPAAFRQFPRDPEGQPAPASSEDLIELLDQYIEVLRIAPLGVPAAGYVGSGFGYRYSPFHGRLSMHEGVDFSLPRGSMISSTGDGVVVAVARNATYGLVVDIAHSDRLVTRYAHLSKVFVSKGEKVCRGEILGLVGSSGRSTGPHLHYEVLVGGKPRNPMPFIKLAADLRHALSLRAQA